MTVLHKLWRFFADDNVGEQETRRMAGMLRTGLAASETDAGFERAMRLMLKRPTGLQTEHEWQALLKRLYDYRRIEEETGYLRVIALRYLSDVERRYPQ